MNMRVPRREVGGTEREERLSRTDQFLYHIRTVLLQNAGEMQSLKSADWKGYDPAMPESTPTNNQEN
jgi:hypothetical protein